MELPRIFLLIVFVPLLFAGFASAQGPGPNTVVITKEDNGKEIVVPEGAIFEVRLEHSGGTGYLWEIVEPDETHLRVLESTEVPLKDTRILGGPLLKTWKIKAVKVGQADLKILLYRPWEGTEKAVDSLHVKILIK
ncbi:MAG: protease inhibitor I42 family protein [Syntrophobacteraceae bacterium]|jgi:predicted secreted protein